MINNLQDYFKPEISIFLDSINYKRVERITAKTSQRISLLCQDNLNASMHQDGVRIIITRTLSFEPAELFNLSVSLGADLKFSDLRTDSNWNDINLAEEFMKNGDFITSQLMSRISLLIGEITSSFGQAPLILPAGLAKNNTEN